MRTFMVILLVMVFAATAGSAQEFKLTSSDLGKQLSETQVYSGMGCTGKNISPELKWTNAPAGTRSFAVTAYDPDAPTGSGWWHWIISNIPATVHELKADAGRPEKKIAPSGSIQSVTDFGKPGYGGACPPAGDRPHRYVFTVYALKVDKLDLDEKTMPAMIGFMLNANMLAKASITSTYKR